MTELRVLAFLACEFFVLCDSFNFDTSHPIVYTDPHKRMGIVRTKSSYFGYSTILYPGGNGSDPWIQVGAPRGTDPGLPVTNPGVVFRCPIRKNCDMMGVEQDTGNLNYHGFQYTDRKDEAWIGGVMDIDAESDMVIVCGSRWSGFFKRKQNFMMGTCYWSSISNPRYYKLLGLAEDENLIYTLGDNSYYFYAMGQSGFSAQLSRSEDGPELLIGAPGVLNWEGTTFIFKNVSSSSRRANVPNVKYTEGALYGYAVSSGHYFDKKNILYVGSSPKKSKYMGEILVFNFQRQSHEDVDVIDSKHGSQMGEGFGSALASGDVNDDGYTDLFVGAPHHKSSKYNEGRVYIFYGAPKKPLVVLENAKAIDGRMAGGQFGTTIAFLEKSGTNRFGDIAVAAPYENDRSGTIYIYRGDANGLKTSPSQIISGKTISPMLKGFGISFSKLTDIDNNGYKDLAVGAYISGHASIIRAKPIVNLLQTVNVWGKKFGTNKTVMEVCLWFTGYRLHPFININRTISLDRYHGRVALENPKDAIKEELLTANQRSCNNYTVIVTEERDLEKPVNIRVIQQLAQQNETSHLFEVGTTSEDLFCPTCPVMGDYAPLEIEVPFALGCGEDNICKSHLTLDVIFKGLGDNAAYIIGSTDEVIMNIGVSNTGELAYTTETVVELPANVFLAFIPKICLERNSSQVIVCKVANPLGHNAFKIVPLRLNMAGLMSQQSLMEMAFTVSVTTSSENLNTVQSKTFLLPLISEADILLTGKSNQPSYSYGDINTGLSTFSQVYQIQKIGKSTIDEVILHIHVPIAMNSSLSTLNFLKFHSVVGSLSGQPFICKNLSYVEYVNELMEKDAPPGENVDTQELEPAPRLLLRRRRQSDFVTPRIVYTNNLNTTDDDFAEFGVAEGRDALEMPSNGFVLDCDLRETKCVTISCTAGPFRNERHVGVVQIRALLNVTALKPLLEKKDKIVLITTGVVRTTDFKQTGELSDRATVGTLFLGDGSAKPVETWIIIIAIVAGLLLLLLVTMGLVKAGFFNRKKKEELEALKKAEAENEFLKDEQRNSAIPEVAEETKPIGEDKSSAEFCEVEN